MILKQILFFLIISIFSSCDIQKKVLNQNEEKNLIVKKTTSDSLTIKEFIKCKPSFEYLKRKKSTYKKWGINIEYIYSERNYDFVKDTKNKTTVLNHLKDKYGDNWKYLFDAEFSFFDKAWFCEFNDKEIIVTTDTLSLNTEKGISYFKFNPNGNFTLWTEFRRVADDEYGEEILTTPYKGKYVIRKNVLILKFIEKPKIEYIFNILNNKMLLLKKTNN